MRKKFLHINALIAIVALLCGCSSQEEQSASQKNWIWIHANETKTEQEWNADFAKYKTAGINAILIGANEKVLNTVIPLAHQLNIEVHAWMWTLNRPGDTTALQNPEWYSVNRLGESCFDKRPYVDYYQWLCPSIPEVQNLIFTQVNNLLEIEGLDGIHLDYVRYCDAILPTDLWSKYDIVQDKVYAEWDYGYNPSNLKAFEAEYGYSPLSLDDPNTDANWVNFRLNTVTQLVNQIATMVHSKNKALTAAVFPSPEMSRTMVYQAWDQWNLDGALPMIYHNFYKEDIAWIGETTAEGVATVNNKFPIYTGLFVPNLEGDSLKKAFDTALQSGAKGWSLFDAASFETIHESKIN